MILQQYNVVECVMDNKTGIHSLRTSVLFIDIQYLKLLPSVCIGMKTKVIINWQVNIIQYVLLWDYDVCKLQTKNCYIATVQKKEFKTAHLVTI